MDPAKLKALNEERKKCVADAGELVSIAAKDGRSMTADEREKFERCHARADEILDIVDPMIRQANAEEPDSIDEFLSTAREPRAGRYDYDSAEERSEPEPAKPVADFATRHNRAFDRWLRVGTASLSREERATLNEARVRAEQRGQRIDQLDRETRAVLEIKTANAGGETVPEGFVYNLIEALKHIGGWRQTRATIYPTATGNDLPWPAFDDTAQAATVVAEAADLDGATLAAPSFVQIVLKAYKYSAGIVKVSTELLEDSAFNLQDVLASAFGKRIARGTNAHFTTGDGSAKPTGISLTAKSLDFGAGTAGGPTYALLNQAMHTLDAAYWPNCEWQMNQTVLQSVRGLADSQGMPIFGAQDIASGRPMTLLGYPITINPALPNWANAAKSLVFGDHSAFKIRDVSSMTLFRFNELYMGTGQVGFTMFSRHDANLIDGHYDGSTANSGEAILVAESST